MTLRTSGLSQAKQEALARCVEGALQIRTFNGRIARKPSGVLAPLALVQEKMWRHAQNHAMPLVYNESITVEHRGPLNVTALERSLAEIIRRHEIWRTTFEVSGGVPRQVVHPALSRFPLRVIDLRMMPKEQRQSAARHCATEQAHKEFDMIAGPLLRASLIQLDDAVQHVSITAHLSIVDGVSAYHVLPFELSTLYKAYAAGEQSPLAELELQYGDYAYWQHEWLIKNDIPAQVEYWRKQFGKEFPILNWPSTRRPPVQTFHGANRSFSLSLELLQNAKELCRREGATLFTVLQSAFTTLLHRYTKQDRFVMGTFGPSGRKRSELQHLLGHFVNPVPLIMDMSGDISFSELLQRSRYVLSNAMSHDDTPLDWLERELRPTKDPSRNPFFTVGVSLQPRAVHTDTAWSVTSMDAESGGSSWDMYLAFIERPFELAGRVQYNPDLFDTEAIRRLSRHLHTLLSTVVTDPHQRLSRLPIEP